MRTINMLNYTIFIIAVAIAGIAQAQESDQALYRGQKTGQFSKDMKPSDRNRRMPLSATYLETLRKMNLSSAMKNQLLMGGVHQGGADLDNGELVDFQYLGQNVRMIVNPRKFEGVFPKIEPLLKRVEYLFPGIDEYLYGVFDKVWLISDWDIPTKDKKLARPVLQNDDYVIINRKWLISAKYIDLAKVYVHEITRYMVTQMLLGSKLEGNQNAIDEKVYLISPLIFFKASQRSLRKKLFGLWEIPHSSGGRRESSFIARIDIYRFFKEHKIAVRAKYFCTPDVLRSDKKILLALKNSQSVRRDFFSNQMEYYSEINNHLGWSESVVSLDSSLQDRFGRLWGHTWEFALYTAAAIDASMYVHRFLAMFYRFKDGQRPKNPKTGFLLMTSAERTKMIRDACHYYSNTPFGKFIDQYLKDNKKLQEF